MTIEVSADYRPAMDIMDKVRYLEEGDKTAQRDAVRSIRSNNITYPLCMAIRYGYVLSITNKGESSIKDVSGKLGISVDQYNQRKEAAKFQGVPDLVYGNGKHILRWLDDRGLTECRYANRSTWVTCLKMIAKNHQDLAFWVESDTY